MGFAVQLEREKNLKTKKKNNKPAWVLSLLLFEQPK